MIIKNLKFILIVCVSIAISACESDKERLINIQTELQDIYVIESFITGVNVGVYDDEVKFKNHKTRAIKKRPYLEEQINSVSLDNEKNSSIQSGLSKRGNELRKEFVALKK